MTDKLLATVDLDHHLFRVISTQITRVSAGLLKSLTNSQIFSSEVSQGHQLSGISYSR
jgi:hypothetical protein